jgi:ubiquinone biosynthesis accessory factor UbiK
MDQKILNDVTERIRELLAASPAADLDKNLRAMLTGLFARLDLVTREEFDVQRQVLLRTREQLAKLELEIAALEQKIAARDAAPPAADRGAAPTGV